MRRLREFTESVGQVVLDGVGRVASRVQERKPLPTDLLESEDAYLVVFDAPGAEMEDVQVRYESGSVEVRIDRFREFHDGYEMLFPGRGLSLEGRVPLPDDAVVDPKAASATLAQNGTLRVEIPKADEDGPVTVERDDAPAGDVRTGDDGPETEPPTSVDEPTGDDGTDDRADDDDETDDGSGTGGASGA